MSWDRSKSMNRRTGLLGWFDRVRYKEIYRQALGLILVAVCAAFAVDGHWRITTGLSIALVGQLFRVFAAGTIFKNKQLASNGAYSLVRHPLYLGNILILGGFSLAGGNFWVALAVLLFFLIWYPSAIAYEDAKLERIFGDEWRTWSEGTNAVFPNRFDWSRLMATQWNARQSMFRNGEFIISVYLLACAGWLWMRAYV